jgi:L-alanine-DL-glutamate epimerase-like enolase superfamily enzyme
MPKLAVRVLSRRLKRPFVISTGSRVVQTAVQVVLREDGVEGVGEASGVSYLGETAQSLAAQIESVRGAIEGGLDREALQDLMAPGGARFAVDSALWDLEARRTGISVARRLGVPVPGSLTTAFTISLDTPAAMEVAAREAAGLALLKVKLGAKDGLDPERARAVRRGAPDATLIADANAGWTPETLGRNADALFEAGFTLLEQPLPAGLDSALDEFDSPLPLCGDESIQSFADIDRVASRYDVVNIKLDKCGGLTHALKMGARLRELDKQIFVGCMICGARAIAPAFLFAQNADFVDLDGPLWLAEDDATLEMDGRGRMSPPPAGLWGDGDPN